MVDKDRIEGSAELYDQLGDAAAYSVIDRHFGFISDRAESAGGTLANPGRCIS